MSEERSIAIVTGGSRGIGKSVSFELARRGFEVFLTYVSRQEYANQVVSEIQAAGGKARAFQLDTGDGAAIETFFNEQVKDKVRLEVLVNNAGITNDKLMMRMKDDDWDKVLNVNLRGPFICLREASKIMARQRYGRIINMVSVVGLMGNAGQANYCAAKAGLVGLTKSAAKELGGRNITVNAVAPGFISTEMTSALPDEIRALYLQQIPLKRFGDPDDVAHAVAFLASDQAGYITGQVLSVNGGMYC